MRTCLKCKRPEMQRAAATGYEANMERFESKCSLYIIYFPIEINQTVK